MIFDFRTVAIISGITKNPTVPTATIAMYDAGLPIGSWAGGTKDSTKPIMAAIIPIPAISGRAGALYGRSRFGCFFRKTMAAAYIIKYIMM